MADAGPVEQLRALAREQGWRVEWETCVDSIGLRFRVVRLRDQVGRWVGGAVCTIGRSGTVETSSAHCALSLLGS